MNHPTSLRKSVKSIGQSMTDLGTGISRSIEMLSVSIMQQHQPHPLNQNVFYQQQHGYPPQSHALQPMSNDGPFSQMMNL